jgi:hypothetical protein
MTGKTICSAATVEELEKVINEYFCSTSYKIEGHCVRSEKTGKTLDDFFVYQDFTGRFRFCRKEK